MLYPQTFKGPAHSSQKSRAKFSMPLIPETIRGTLIIGDIDLKLQHEIENVLSGIFKKISSDQSTSFSSVYSVVMDLNRTCLSHVRMPRKGKDQAY